MATPPTGAIVRALLDEGAVRLLVVEATAPAEHTRVIHGLGPDAARLGAEAVVAAALNAAHVKGQEQLAVQLQGEEPRCAIYADITAEGEVRARVTPADLHLGDQSLVGVLMAIKSVDGRELYRGLTEVRHPTLEAALAEHLTVSSQVEDVLRIGVRIGESGEIVQAGGLLLERLPEEPDRPSLSREAFHTRYAWVRDADITQLLTQLAFGSLADQALEVLESRRLTWVCRCSRARIEAMLVGLGDASLREMIAEDQGAEVRCHFCGTVYRLDEGELEGLLDRVGPTDRSEG